MDEGQHSALQLMTFCSLYTVNVGADERGNRADVTTPAKLWLRRSAALSVNFSILQIHFHLTLQSTQ